jgi:hypothetical protein
MSAGIPTRLVQIAHPEEGRRAAVVYANQLHLLATYRSVYAFCQAALETGWKLRDLLSTDLSGIVLDYEQVHGLDTEWRFLPAFDHPEAPGKCLVSAAEEGGWRYTGYGAMLRAHGEPLEVSSEGFRAAPGEVAAVYLVDRDGTPRRVGIAAGNAGGNAATRCAIGPELTLEVASPRLNGVVRLVRAGEAVWSGTLSDEDAPLALALASIEPEYFENSDHRRPGDAHILFFGRQLFGAREAIAVSSGDEIVVELPCMGLPLRNPIHVEQPAISRLAAVPL